MLKVEIHSTDLNTFTWTDKKNVSRQGHKQSGYVHLPGHPYPKEIQLRVDDPSKAYPQGFYLLDPKSFYVDRYGSLACSPVLVPDSSAKNVKPAVAAS